MTIVERVALGVAVVMLAVLLWTLDPAAVGRMVLGVGWGLVLIVSQEIVPHLFNALGWRFAFTSDHAVAFSFLELVKLRIAGDAINYLTPSATIAGEFTRTAMLNDSHRPEVRGASVLIAKCTQTLAQSLFAAAGVALAFGGQITGLRDQDVDLVVALGIAVAVVIASLGLRRTRRRPGSTPRDSRIQTGFRAVLAGSRDFVARHPERCALSISMFLLGYAWGAFEAYWICHFIGLPVGVRAALTIEGLSTAVDGLLFIVPAKIGTQEGGKAAVFATLGLPASSGLAFGIVRHVRELIWAGFGLLLRWTHALPAARRSRSAI
jgi:hypothetical protein